MGLQNVCNAAVMPLKTKSKGLAPKCEESKEDIIDEAIKYFRANVLFKNYEIQGSADLVLIYLTVFISHLLREMNRFKTKDDATKHVYTLTRKDFKSPGERDFTIPGYFSAPSSTKERSF